MPRTPLLSRLSRLQVPTGRGLSRRQLIELGLLAAAAPAMACRGGAVDGRVVVIGAGVAGLHCAWRLVQAGLDVQVYEASNRVGGRMWTGRELFAGGLQCELGGELIDTNHVTMWELADEFDIALDDRWAEERPTTLRETWWVDGRAVPEEEIVSQYVDVAPTIAAAFDSAEATDAGYTELDETPMDAFLDTVCPASAYPELHTILTAAYRGEFGLELDRQSCLNLVYLIDSVTPDPFRVFGESDERYHAHDGNDTFPTRLAQAVGEERIALSTRLVAVRDRHGGGYQVEVLGPDGTTIDEAEHVVFALPFSTLRNVTLECEELLPVKQRIIDELGYGTNAKVMGGFTRRVWFEDHDAAGAATADLPFQQCWDSTPGQDGGGAGVLTNYVSGDHGLASGNGTDTDWFSDVVTDLETIWPGSADAWDGTAVRMFWPRFEWSMGSYTCYTPGQWAFWSKEGRRNGNLHFCGEHCSLDFQGWMEGAAETGALVAAEIIDDAGAEKSARHARIVAAKTLAPQACYHGDLLPSTLRPRARRFALNRRIGELLRTSG